MSSDSPRSGPPAGSLPRSPIVATITELDGWLAQAEAEALIVAAEHVVLGAPRGRGAVIVEVGSYCGKSTVVFGLTIMGLGATEARVYAVDPHEGEVTSTDQHRIHLAPTWETFRRNIADAGVAPVVEPVPRRSVEVPWDSVIDLLFVDGLHDYDSVSADFGHFSPWLRVGGLVAFHDCDSHFPGVRRLVDEVRATGAYRDVSCVQSLVVLEKV